MEPGNDGEEVGHTRFALAKPGLCFSAGKILADFPLAPAFIDERSVSAGAVRDVDTAVGQGNDLGVQMRHRCVLHGDGGRGIASNGIASNASQRLLGAGLTSRKEADTVSVDGAVGCWYP